MAVSAWLPCGLIFACAALTLGRDEDAMQVLLFMTSGNWQSSITTTRVQSLCVPCHLCLFLTRPCMGWTCP